MNNANSYSKGMFQTLNEGNTRILGEAEMPVQNSFEGTFVIQFDIDGTGIGTLDGNDNSVIRII